MKLIYLTLWIMVIFLVPGSFAQLTQTSETPTQGAYETGISQTPLGTETPSQQTYLDGVNQTLPGEQTPTQQAFSVGTNQTTPRGQKSVSPEITIISPKEGAMIPAGNVTVMVNVTNFKQVNMLGAKNVAGEGYIHYYIDVPVPTTPGKLAVTAAGTFAPKYNTSWTWPNVNPGNTTSQFSLQITTIPR